MTEKMRKKEEIKGRAIQDVLEESVTDTKNLH